jgi:hypothetical protein
MNRYTSNKLAINPSTKLAINWQIDTKLVWHQTGNKLAQNWQYMSTKLAIN